MSLVAGLAISLFASSASAAFFSATDLGGNLFRIDLNGEAGDPSGAVTDADIQSIIVTGTTAASWDLNGSIFFGKAFGPTGTVAGGGGSADVGGSDLFGTSAGPMSPTAVLELGKLQLNGAPTDLTLGGTGIFTSNLVGAVVVPISQSAGSSLLPLPEPASLLLLGLGLGAFAFVRRQKA